MKGYVELFRQNREIMVMGLLLTLFSSFGQTFLLSLYLPSLKDFFEIGDSAIGYLYGAATLCSALALTYTGKFIDTVSLRKYIVFILIGFGLSHFLMAVSYHLVIIFVAFFGLRHFGQGLMGHTAMTVMARTFSASRGKALGFSVLGYPIGEAITPTLIFLSILYFDWRITLILIGFFLLLVVLPLMYRLSAYAPSLEDVLAEKGVKEERSWSQKNVLTNSRFYILAPNVFSLSFIITAILFYQLSLADYKDWPHAWMAVSFVGYAVSGSLSVILAGWLIDKFSAKKIYPFFLIPMVIGIVFIMLSQSPWSYTVFLILSGVSSGIGSPAKDAIIAEVYGIKTIGTVRSLFTAMMVFSTAAGPPIIGYFIDYISFYWAFAFCIGMIAISFIPALMTLKSEFGKK